MDIQELVQELDDAVEMCGGQLVCEAMKFYMIFNKRGLICEGNMTSAGCEQFLQIQNKVDKYDFPEGAPSMLRSFGQKHVSAVSLWLWGERIRQYMYYKEHGSMLLQSMISTFNYLHNRLGGQIELEFSFNNWNAHVTCDGWCKIIISVPGVLLAAHNRRNLHIPDDAASMFKSLQLIENAWYAKMPEDLVPIMSVGITYAYALLALQRERCLLCELNDVMSNLVQEYPQLRDFVNVEKTVAEDE